MSISRGKTLPNTSDGVLHSIFRALVYWQKYRNLNKYQVSRDYTVHTFDIVVTLTFLIIFQKVLTECCEYLRKNLPENVTFRYPDVSGFLSEYIFKVGVT